uniref:MMS19 nucleotide excision repair protein n=1 Tax=Sphaeramia orbicularis TaxID=375764 RepID=A0A672Z0M2_9TELE
VFMYLLSTHKDPELFLWSRLNEFLCTLHIILHFRLSLTSSQPHTRARGVQLLSEVLQECYGDLTEREVEVLIAFYENRLKDHYVITPPVLRGLKALTKCTVLPPGSAVSMLRSLFQDVHVQSLMLAERACVYNMLINLMETREAELKGLGADFVFGFVQSMDGERDPRNLLLAFQIAKTIISRGYDLGKFTEELFEVTSCYFPIDFTPPPNDPHGITKEDLIQMLRAVLTGTPKFAEFLLPLIIEKLDSDVQSAKLDSLQTLTVCVSQYEHKDLAEFLEGLWVSIRREVFQTSSERIESACLAALTALTSCLSRSVLSSESEDCLSTFLDLVLKDCKHHLSEPDLKLVWPSAKLLQASCSASIRASHVITASVMPNIVEQYNIWSHYNLLCFPLCVFPPPLEDSVFLAYRESLCSMVFSALSESNSSLQITATSVLTSLGQQTGDIQSHMGKKSDLGHICLQSERSLSSCFSQTACLPSALMDQDNTEASEKLSHHAVRQRCLSALAAVSVHPSVVQESTPVLLEVLSSAHTGKTEVVLACRSLQRIAEQVQDTEETGRCFHEVIIPRLLGLTLQAALQGVQLPQEYEAVLSAMVPVISTSCSRLQPQSQQGSTWRQSQMVCLLMGCVCSLPPSVRIPQLDELLSELEEMSCTCTHTLSYTSAAKCFAGLINKSLQGALVLQVFNLRPCSHFVAKALLVRYHPLSTTLTDKLFSLLDNTDLGSMAADGFSLLMSDSADVLNRACHADVRIMYRQRFFSENSAKLVQGFNAAPQEKKPNYLKALSNIVNKLPKQVQVTELPALLSLLLEALSCPDGGVQLSTLSCLEPVLADPPAALIQQLEALVSRLLALTSSPAMDVRIASLRCIHALSRFPVLPFRAQVLRALARPLDDKKRLVRNEAVQARGEWYDGSC